MIREYIHQQTALAMRLSEVPRLVICIEPRDRIEEDDGQRARALLRALMATPNGGLMVASSDALIFGFAAPKTEMV